MTLTSTCQGNGDIVINSGARLTIESAADLMRLLREGLEASQHVSVELEPGVEIDITAIQLFCSACKAAAAKGKTFSCRGPLPQSLKDLIEASGAERHDACKQNMDSNCAWFGDSSQEGTGVKP